MPHNYFTPKSGAGAPHSKAPFGRKHILLMLEDMAKTQP
jgi:hypothetical protein